MKKLTTIILALVMVLTLTAGAFADSGIFVTKNPTDETRTAGTTAWFVSDATGYTALRWTFTNPVGEDCTVQDFRNAFPYATVEGENTTQLTIRNLDTWMTGWSVYCTFFNGNGSADTIHASLNVTAYVTPAYAYPEYAGPSYYIPYGATDGGYTYDENGHLEYDVYYPDGHYTTFYYDGSSFTDYLDGTYRYDSSDGSVAVFNDDGYRMDMYSNGYWEVYDPITDSISGGMIYD